MRIIAILLFLFFTGPNNFGQNVFDPDLKPYLDKAEPVFPFGVASGDPQQNGVVIWTKILDQNADNQPVSWEVATDTTLQNVVQLGTEDIKEKIAFTVKIFVENLSPGTTYFYRFKYKNTYSPIGRTKTAPDGNPNKLRFAVVSCADFQGGEFNAYGHIAQRTDIDVIVHLGDYIYESGAGQWGTKRNRPVASRVHIPASTCTSLRDYRTRYAQYRLDAQLRECHRLHPFITIWDDHEISNNVNAGEKGPQWDKREAAARQAYFEWLPIKDNPEHSIIRSFSFGNLAEMWMLDSRLEGRSPQAKGLHDPNLGSMERHMLGGKQTDWLLNGMANSKARWKIMGNQVIFSPMHDSKVFDRRPALRMDRWDGYPAEQQHIFDFFYQNNIQNIIVVTGDVHTAWAFELTARPLDKGFYDPKTGKGVIGAEFVTPSVTSFNLDELLGTLPRLVAAIGKRRFKKNKYNPHLRYVDLIRHGYFTLTLTPEKAQADWYFIKRKDRVDLKIGKKKRRAINYNGNHISKK